MRGIKRGTTKLWLLGLACAGLAIAIPATASAGTRRAPPRAVVPGAECSAEVVGQVVDLDGKAMAGVTVLATRARPDGREHPRVESDRDGKFRFALPPGEYVFVALHRRLAGLTPPMQVVKALEVVLVLTASGDAA